VLILTKLHQIWPMWCDQLLLDYLAQFHTLPSLWTVLRKHEHSFSQPTKPALPVNMLHDLARASAAAHLSYGPRAPGEPEWRIQAAYEAVREGSAGLAALLLKDEPDYLAALPAPDEYDNYHPVTYLHALHAVSTSKGTYLCWRCGEQGHRFDQCKHPPSREERDRLPRHLWPRPQRKAPSQAPQPDSAALCLQLAALTKEINALKARLNGALGTLMQLAATPLQGSAQVWCAPVGADTPSGLRAVAQDEDFTWFAPIGAPDAQIEDAFAHWPGRRPP
jgi:hypothetical protein